MKTFLQRGFGAIAAIVVLVVLAALAAAITRLGIGQQVGSGQDIASVRAWQAARAGTEWGIYVALQNKACPATTTLDLTAGTGAWVTVTCTAKSYKEGEVADSSTGTVSFNTVNVFTVSAIACNVSGICPASGSEVASPFYVERARQIIVVR